MRSTLSISTSFLLLSLPHYDTLRVLQLFANYLRYPRRHSPADLPTEAEGLLTLLNKAFAQAFVRRCAALVSPQETLSRMPTSHCARMLVPYGFMVCMLLSVHFPVRGRTKKSSDSLPIYRRCSVSLSPRGVAGLKS